MENKTITNNSEVEFEEASEAVSPDEINYDFNENPILKETIPVDSPFKQLVVEYVGERFQPENAEVTVEMVVVTMMEEFPEFLMAIAEENFMRGYQQGLADVEASEQRASELEKIGSIDPEYLESDESNPLFNV